MVIKNKWIVSAGLVVIAVAGILTANIPIATLCAGGLIGWLAGEANGESEA